MTRSDYFLTTCVAFVAGILAGSYFVAEMWVILFLESIMVMLFFVFRKNKWSRYILILGCINLGVIVVSSKIHADRLNIAQNGLKNESQIIIRAEIEHIDRTKNSKQGLVLDGIQNIESGNKIAGKIQVFAEKYPEYRDGDIVEIAGKIKEPGNMEEFDYKMYLQSKGIYYLLNNPKITLVGNANNPLRNMTRKIRQYVYELNKKVYPEPQSSIMNALILGIESDISEDIIDAFNKTGTRHLLAISGFNISIIALVMMQLLHMAGMKRSRAFYLSSIGIVLYILIIESSASSIRAGIMGELVLIANKIGRLPASVNAIVFAGALMLVQNPYLARYDVGFQLSFLAVLGLIFIYPKLDGKLEKLPDFMGLKSIFLGTLSAEAATLPVIIGNFGYFSMLSVASNMLILPVAVTVMLGGYAVAAIASLSIYFGRIVSWPIWLLVEYQVRIVEKMSEVQWGMVEYKNLSPAFIIIYYLMLAFLIFGKQREKIVAKFKKIPKMHLRLTD